MAKARAIHMGAIRAVRDSVLETLDISFLRAVEDGNTDLQAMIAADKTRLRDIPQTFDLTTALTPAELKGLWPDRLPK